MRVKGGVTKSRRHKKILKATSGYRLTKSKLYRVAHEAYMHAGQYSYAHRRRRQSQMRTLWIIRISAAARGVGMTYREFMHKIKEAGISLNRKMLADIAFHDIDSFKEIADSFSK